MPIPPLTDGQINSESPLAEALMKDGLRDRDDWLWQDADNGGTGIDANVTAFFDAFGTPGHSHNGDPGQGANIPTTGIANGAASQNQMFTDNCVTPAKLPTNGVHTEDFADLAVTVEKFSGTMGVHVGPTGHIYDEFGPLTGDSLNFQGDRVKISPHPRGRPGVVCNAKQTASTSGGSPAQRVDFWVIEQTDAYLLIGFDYISGLHDVAGQWYWDFHIV